MAFVDVAALADDPAFKARVKACAAKVALSVAGNIGKNDDQTRFAVALLRDIDVMAPVVSFAVAAGIGGVAAAVDTDPELQTQVVDVLTAMARR